MASRDLPPSGAGVILEEFDSYDPTWRVLSPSGDAILVGVASTCDLSRLRAKAGPGDLILWDRGGNDDKVCDDDVRVIDHAEPNNGSS